MQDGAPQKSAVIHNTKVRSVKAVFPWPLYKSLDLGKGRRLFLATSSAYALTRCKMLASIKEAFVMLSKSPMACTGSTTMAGCLSAIACGRPRVLTSAASSLAFPSAALQPTSSRADDPSDKRVRHSKLVLLDPHTQMSFCLIMMTKDCLHHDKLPVLMSKNPTHRQTCRSLLGQNKI